jgi:hypothetical protein
MGFNHGKYNSLGTNLLSNLEDNKNAKLQACSKGYIKKYIIVYGLILFPTASGVSPDIQGVVVAVGSAERL